MSRAGSTTDKQCIWLHTPLWPIRTLLLYSHDLADLDPRDFHERHLERETLATFHRFKKSVKVALSCAEPHGLALRTAADQTDNEKDSSTLLSKEPGRGLSGKQPTAPAEVQTKERNRSSPNRRSGRISLHWKNKFIDKTHRTVQRLHHGILAMAHSCSSNILTLWGNSKSTAPYNVQTARSPRVMSMCKATARTRLYTRRIIPAMRQTECLPVLDSRPSPRGVRPEAGFKMKSLESRG